MRSIRLNGTDGPYVNSAEEMAGRFHAELIAKMPGWKQRLADNPEMLEELERDVHESFARGADLVTAGLMSMVMQREEFVRDVDATRRNFAFGLRKGREREIRVRLLGGLVIWICSLYCAPGRSLTGKTREGAHGVYIELAQFGFAKGCSPALESLVARSAAWSPSFELAKRELARNGVTMDTKTVRRVTYQCGEGFLSLRTHEMLAMRDGTLAAGNELHGLRVMVQIDGGRSRIRGKLRKKPPQVELVDEDGLLIENQPGRSKPVAKRTFDLDWREPKLVIIAVHDEHGKMVSKFQATIDGTFQGPEAIAEIIAMHLHRLGAAKAASVTFVADGAPWIWDRIPEIVRRAGLKDVPIHEVLDCCHAAHHISLALSAMGFDKQERMPLYRLHRTMLRNGQWQRVVEELTDLAADDPENRDVQREIAYLTRHGEAGRLKYPTFRGQGLPLGSGSIESCIRRVVNLRMKGNGIYWKEPNAEAMLQVRSQMLSERWDSRLQEVRLHEKQHGRRKWPWEPLLHGPTPERAEDLAT
jgi:hypothetical protein